MLTCQKSKVFEGGKGISKYLIDVLTLRYLMDNIKSGSVSDDTNSAMPIRNIISIVGALAVSTWAYEWCYGETQ